MKAPFPELQPVFDAATSGRLDLALERALKVLKTASGPLAIEARRHVGLIYFNLGDFASAEPYLDQVARLTNERDAWFVLAMLRTRSNNPKAGEFDFSRALAAPEPPVDLDEGRHLTDHFMRFDYMHALAETWQWERAKAQLDLLIEAVLASPSHDDAFLLQRGLPRLGDVLHGGLAVLEVIPNSDPFAWLNELRGQLTNTGRREVDRALIELRQRVG